ncbi:unnamed protein product [Schistosoma turkestanicum]|nr:unnamed protein product [Schistosoma turkestanicum]
MMKKRPEPISCPVCSKSVYFAEEVRAMGRAFHKQCFKCCQCSKSLDSFTANDHKGSLYCKSCYAKNYGPNIYGFSTNGTLGRSTYDLRDCTKVNGYTHSHSPMINQSHDYHHHPQQQERSSNWETSGNYIPRTNNRTRWSSGNFGSASNRCAKFSVMVCGNEIVYAIGKVFPRLCF